MAVIAGPTREAIRHGHQIPMLVRTDLPAKTICTVQVVSTGPANFGLAVFLHGPNQLDYRP